MSTNECIICYENTTNDEDIIELECKCNYSKYHKKCMIEWLSKDNAKNKCLNCFKDIDETFLIKNGIKEEEKIFDLISIRKEIFLIFYFCLTNFLYILSCPYSIYNNNYILFKIFSLDICWFFIYTFCIFIFYILNPKKENILSLKLISSVVFIFMLLIRLSCIFYLLYLDHENEKNKNTILYLLINFLFLRIVLFIYDYTNIYHNNIHNILF